MPQRAKDRNVGVQRLDVIMQNAMSHHVEALAERQLSHDVEAVKEKPHAHVDWFPARRFHVLQQLLGVPFHARLVVSKCCVWPCTYRDVDLVSLVFFFFLASHAEKDLECHFYLSNRAPCPNTCDEHHDHRGLLSCAQMLMGSSCHTTVP